MGKNQQKIYYTFIFRDLKKFANRQENFKLYCIQEKFRCSELLQKNSRFVVINMLKKFERKKNYFKDNTNHLKGEILLENDRQTKKSCEKESFQ